MTFLEGDVYLSLLRRKQWKSLISVRLAVSYLEFFFSNNTHTNNLNVFTIES